MTVQCPFCDAQVPNIGTWENHYIYDHGKNMSAWDIAQEIGKLMRGDKQPEPEHTTHNNKKPRGLFLSD